MDKFISKVGYLLLDLDGVISMLNPEFNDHCLRVLAETFVELGVPLTVDEAFELAKSSHKRRGTCSKLFYKFYGKLQDVNPKKFNAIFPRKIDYSLIKESQITAEQLRACPIPIAIFSHSTPFWVEAVLKQIGLHDVVKELGIRIITSQDVGNKPKTTIAAYRKALKILVWPPEQTAIFEDTLKNLGPPKRLGMLTGFILRGRKFKPEKDPQNHPYVDYVFNTLNDFWQAVGAAYKNRPNPVLPSSLIL